MQRLLTNTVQTAQNMLSAFWERIMDMSKERFSCVKFKDKYHTKYQLLLAPRHVCCLANIAKRPKRSDDRSHKGRSHFLRVTCSSGLWGGHLPNENQACGLENWFANAACLDMRSMWGRAVQCKARCLQEVRSPIYSVAAGRFSQFADGLSTWSASANYLAWSAGRACVRHPHFDPNDHPPFLMCAIS